MRSLTSAVHPISLGVVNVFLLETVDGLVLIDTGFPGHADKILKAMAKLGFAPGRLAHIVLTHAHPDHIGSLADLVRQAGAQTWMHRLDAPIAEGQASPRPVHPTPGLLSKLLFAAMARLPRAVEPAQIDHKVGDGDVLPGGLQAIHVPGHCAGQIALLWPDRRILFAADACMNLFALRPPRVNEDTLLGAQSLRRLATLEFDTAYFGHGHAMTQNAAARFRKAFAA